MVYTFLKLSERPADLRLVEMDGEFYLEMYDQVLYTSMDSMLAEQNVETNKQHNADEAGCVLYCFMISRDNIEVPTSFVTDVQSWAKLNKLKLLYEKHTQD